MQTHITSAAQKKQKKKPSRLLSSNLSHVHLEMLNATGILMTPVLLQTVVSTASLAVAHEPAGPPAAMLHQLQSKLTTPNCILSTSNNKKCGLSTFNKRQCTCHWGTGSDPYFSLWITIAGCFLSTTCLGHQITICFLFVNCAPYDVAHTCRRWVFF